MASADMVVVSGVEMSAEAAGLVEWAGVDVAGDVTRLAGGAVTKEALLAACLDGAESEHKAGWRDYVSSVVARASEMFANLLAGVAASVGDDGTGDLGVIVRQAISDDPNVTAQEIAAIVREARDDARVERERA